MIFNFANKEEENLFLLKQLNITGLTYLVEEFEGGNKDIFFNLKEKYLNELVYPETQVGFKSNFNLYRINDISFSLITLPNTILDMCLKYYELKLEQCNKKNLLYLS